MRRVPFAASAALMAILTLAACRPRSSAPPDVANLEREVSLELAHVRDVGPTDPEQRRKLGEAADLDREAERAIAAQDWRTAEDKFLQAQAILHQLEL
jgi:hypothetical protein